MNIRSYVLTVVACLATLLSTHFAQAKGALRPAKHVYAVFPNTAELTRFLDALPPNVSSIPFAPLVERARPVQQFKESNGTQRLRRTASVFSAESLPLEEWKAEFEVSFVTPSPARLLFDPNDPQVNSQSYVHTIDAKEAWNIEQGDASIIVGVSDAGTDQYHEDLIDNIRLNEQEIFDNGIDDDNNGFVDDYAGVNMVWEVDGSDASSTFGMNHGTQVAGIVGATFNNEVGISGLGGYCRFFPMKIYAQEQEVFLGFESMLYAAANGIDVLNCSWGSNVEVNVERDITALCVEIGMTVVAGAGNTGSSSEYAQPLYPAAYPGVIGVAVTWPDNTLVSESTLGWHCDVAAPGHEAWTTYNNNEYGNFYLTSSATPVVSGVAALVRSKWPHLNSYQVQSILRKSGADIRAFNPSNADMVPVSVRADKALLDANLQTPGISIESFEFVYENKQPIRTDFIRQYGLKLHLLNHLAAGDGLTATLSVGVNTLNSLEVVDSVSDVFSIGEGGLAEVNGLEFRVVSEDTRERFFTIEFANADRSYVERMQIPVTPTPEYATMRTSKSSLTLADNGRVGFADNRIDRRNKGVGMRYGAENVLYEGGLMAGYLDGRIYSSTRDLVFPALADEFTVVQKIRDFSGPPEGRVAAGDNSPFDTTSIQVDTRVLPDEMSGLFLIYQGARFLVEKDVVPKPAFGYYLDIDVGEVTDDNSAIVNTYYDIDPIIASLSICSITSPTSDVQAIVAVVHPPWNEQTGSPVLAVISNDPDNVDTPFGTTDGFSNDERIEAFESGLQYSELHNTDIGVVVGSAHELKPNRDHPYEGHVLVLGSIPKGDNAYDAVMSALLPYTTDVETSVDETRSASFVVDTDTWLVPETQPGDIIQVHNLAGQISPVHVTTSVQGQQLLFQPDMHGVYLVVVNGAEPRRFVILKQ